MQFCSSTKIKLDSDTIHNMYLDGIREEALVAATICLCCKEIWILFKNGGQLSLNVATICCLRKTMQLATFYFTDRCG